VKNIWTLPVAWKTRTGQELPIYPDPGGQFKNEDINGLVLYTDITNNILQNTRCKALKNFRTYWDRTTSSKTMTTMQNGVSFGIEVEDGYSSNYQTVLPYILQLKRSKLQKGFW